jgi:hypothetical protein
VQDNRRLSDIEMVSKECLRRRTTVAESEAEYGFDTLAGWRLEKWQALKAEIEATLVNGGQLWEWESEGFRVLAGIGGLAVVRDGQIVNSWQLWKS